MRVATLSGFPRTAVLFLTICYCDRICPQQQCSLCCTLAAQAAVIEDSLTHVRKCSAMVYTPCVYRSYCSMQRQPMAYVEATRWVCGVSASRLRKEGSRKKSNLYL
jgi:hypothetical protein